MKSLAWIALIVLLVGCAVKKSPTSATSKYGYRQATFFNGGKAVESWVIDSGVKGGGTIIRFDLPNGKTVKIVGDCLLLEPLDEAEALRLLKADPEVLLERATGIQEELGLIDLGDRR